MKPIHAKLHVCRLLQNNKKYNIQYINVIEYNIKYINIIKGFSFNQYNILIPLELLETLVTGWLEPS